MKLPIPTKVTEILTNLTANGYEAYAVGGCVRDTILGRIPDDWDITTAAPPAQVKKLFRRTVDTGLAHGTVTVLLGTDSYEVTTFRTDGAYADHRHPDEVHYASGLQEDLRRRDFTINAMAYHPDRGLVDPYGGREDLQEKRIRCVGCPRERFEEDALRILRAVRFAAQLGFTIEEKTMEALKERVPTLSYVSKERIQTELVKLLLSPHPEEVRCLADTGILREILPELPGISNDCPAHLVSLPAGKHLRLAALMLPLGRGQAQAALRRLKFDNETIARVGRLVAGYSYEIEETPAGMRRGLHDLGDDLMDDLLTFQSLRRPVDGLRSLYREILAGGQCYKLSQLAISGDDLLALGIAEGRAIGSALAQCLDLVLEDPDCNRKDLLLDYCRKNVLTGNGIGETVD